MRRAWKAVLGAVMLLAPAMAHGQLTPWFQWTFLPRSKWI